MHISPIALNNKINFLNKPQASQSLNIKNTAGDSLKCDMFQLNFKGHDRIEPMTTKINPARDELNNMTAFFREPGTLESIKEYLAERFPNDEKIKIYDGACSSGEEAWTLKMILDSLGDRVSITGFDLGKQAIADAQSKTYEVLEEDSDEYSIYSVDSSIVYSDEFEPDQQIKGYKQLFDKYFEPAEKEKTFRVKPEYQDTIDFINGNILEMDKFVKPKSADVILFRNALYHMTTYDAFVGRTALWDFQIEPVLKKFVKQISQALKKDGLFVIGTNVNDNIDEVAEPLYKLFEKHGFEPFKIEQDRHGRSIASIWKKCSE